MVEGTLRYRRNFYVNRDRLTLLAGNPAPVLDSDRAGKLAIDSLRPGEAGTEVTIAKVAPLTHTLESGEKVRFFQVNLLSNGSEIIRVVLMDGGVIRSRLTKVSD